MDDFDREVYCIGGLPFDAIDLTKTLSHLRYAKQSKTTCFLTTPNLNFLALSLEDTEFRNSVIYSDLVIADGAPIVWMAKLVGIPIRERVAGSTLFEAIGKEQRRKMAVYFFGGQDGVGEMASKRINEKSTGLTCVGHYSPGFGSLDEMSNSKIIDDINFSAADFLVVALGAKKGQAWIVNNLQKIKIPLVSHLGAVINFESRLLKRAPIGFQKLGFEWLWRIKEEPHLWRRYWVDGQVFIKILFTKVLPHAIWLKLNKNRLNKTQTQVDLVEDEKLKLKITGVVLDPINADIRKIFRYVASQKKELELDVSHAEYLSFGFFGLLLMLKKQLDKNKLKINLIGITPSMRKLLSLNGLTYLIE
jgi:N-acetylglucosaminyldiphosphoundecaprenol N-acetyl-beta-D-mannosaminyltransferase